MPGAELGRLPGVRGPRRRSGGRVMDIQRGWFYQGNLSPQRGTEPRKTRPVLVLQTDLLNAVEYPSTVVLFFATHLQAGTDPLSVHVPAGSFGF